MAETVMTATNMQDIHTLQHDLIQGLVLSGYGHLSHAGYLFLFVQDAAKARTWLKTLIPTFTNAVRPQVKPATCLNIAFTYGGLEAFGVPAAALASFSTEFREGPAERHRARLMGDVGKSDPETWDYGGPNTPGFHILLAFFGDGEEARDSLREEHRAKLQAGGLIEICTQNGYRTPDSHEHFGFFDGVSQPAIKTDPASTAPMDVEPGEFLFGYMSEYQHISPIPGLTALKSDVLGKHGTYLIYRKLAQDVKAFHDFLKTATDGSEAQMEYLGAKMVGRWKSGAPLVDAPVHDNPALGADMRHNNDFQYAEVDAHGLRCPVGSHIRRTNPRDSLEPNPAESVKTVKRHMIMRRGRSYGALYDGTNLDHPRGIAFICVNADIKRQFEFIQQTWVNDARFAGLYDTKDPIVADRDVKHPHTTLIIPRDPYRQAVRNIPQFVTMRGGGYFFLPGLPALEYLAGLDT